MMKKKLAAKNPPMVFLLAVFLMVAVVARSQEKNTIRINSLSTDAEQFAKTANKYKDFTNGQVLFKNGGTTSARLNYNILTSQVLFIAGGGDTLSLGEPETINKVIIGVDTFYHHDGSFLQRLSHYPGKVNLNIRYKMKYLGKEKKGAYGTFSEVSSVTSKSSLVQQDQRTQYLPVDENSIYKNNADLFFSDRFNNFLPATKRNFIKLNLEHDEEVDRYIKEHKVDFNDQQQLMALVDYTQSLK